MSQVDEIDGATATQQPHEVLAPSVTGTELRILPFEDADPVRQFATITFLRGGLIAIAITLVGGLLGALYSVPSLAPTFQSLGLDLRQLRPVHTTFASAWIFLGGMAVVHRYLMDHGGYATDGDRWRLRIQVLCWAAAGFGILVTLLAGVGSGREYVGFHPAFSVLILTGWLCYAWNFFRIVGPAFWNRPLYVTMWGVGTVFFVYTFLEQHAYLLPEFWGDPVHDLRVQWKATGTLVGAFNLFVYGSIIYIGERISGDAEYGHSRTAYALFAVGLLNSFTNFAHHTYHLPQRDLVKWISFVVSMMEIIILVRAVSDLVKLVRTREDRPFCATRGSFSAAKYWSVAIVGSAVLISVPPLNAIIHGTYAVTGHAMGATIGIDTMILLGAVIWIVGEYLRGREGEDASNPLHCARMRWSVIGLNVGVALLVGWLHLAGVVTGLTRMRLAPSEVYVPPAWLASSSGIMFAATGTLAFVFFSSVLVTLIPLSFRSFRTEASA
jgi:nitric oxide reductase subunit B